MTWIARLFRRRETERRLDAELFDHLERHAADLVAGGMAEAEARRRATLELGGLEQVKEACRDVRGTRLVEDLAADVRYGVRALRKSPVFTAVAVLSLALGIGANAAIFSLVDKLILSALPVAEPRQLVRIEGGSWTNPIWEQIRDRQHDLFDGAAAWSDEGVQFNLADGGPADLVDGLWVSGDFFTVLGVPPLLGRTIGPADDRRAAGPEGAVAVISYRFWQQRFGGAVDAVGRSLTLNRVPYTIVGVTPPRFFGPSVGRSFDVAAPIATEPLQRGADSWLEDRSAWWLEIVGRLKPGQSLIGAQNRLRMAQAQIREATLPPGWRPEDLRRYLRGGLTLVPATTGISELRQRYQEPLLTLTGVVGLVLLLACANLANLLLARADGRQHELALRLTLGASRWRLARQLLTESLLLAGCGGALGLLVARWGSDLLVRQLSLERTRIFLDLSFDWRVLAFTAAVAVATALLFGTAPAFRSRRADPSEALKHHAGRGLTGERRGALGGPLVVVQVALSLVLLVAAGLFVETFSRLARQDIGFDRSSILLVGLDAQSGSLDASRRQALFERALETARPVPGVEHAALSFISPVSGVGWNTRFRFPERADLTERDRLSWMNAVTPGWFATYRTRILAGRDFEVADRAGAPRVAIVNEAFAKKLLGPGSPLGRTIQQEGSPGHPSEPFEIVGVAESAAYRSVREPIAPTVFVPLAQAEGDAPPFATLSLRSAGRAPALLTKDVAAALHSVDPHLSLTFRPLAEQVDASLAQERIVAMLSGFFGALAMLLAGIGLYGVASYAVSRRRTEIGVRMALGADASRVMGLIVGRVGVLVALGLGVGAVVSAWASRFIGALLFGVEPRDPATFAGAALMLAIVAGVASWLPARRAARIDPALALREG